jgi:hypothetical protein
VGVTGVTGNGYRATSTTSLAIAVAVKAFTTQANLAYTTGARARATSTVNGANYMEGLVTAYSGTTLTINVDKIGGSGTLASWNINLAGDVGATGVAGPTGPTGVTGAQGIQGVIGITGPQGAIGVTGATGPQGVQGVQGISGVKGTTGATGVVGPTGTTGPMGEGFAATSVTSLAIGTGSKVFITQAGLAYAIGGRVRASSNAAPTNYMEGIITAYVGTSLTVNVDKIGGSGTKIDWNINAGGDVGATGPIGNTGPLGPTGPQGIQGIQGIQGAVGVTGPTGIQGVQGIQGAQGITGPSGPQGVVGPTGPIGVTGPQGVVGTTGVTGAQGAGYKGTSVTSLAIGTGTKAFATQAGMAFVAGQRARAIDTVSAANWMEGVVASYVTTTLTVTVDLIGGSGTKASWNITEVGAVGLQGSTGPVGVTGPIGNTGPIGVTGPQGVAGVTGNTGVQGVQGPAGATGITGVQGAGYRGTSTDSEAIATGSKVFTTQAGMAFVPGIRARAVYVTDTTRWMEGAVTAYSGTSLTILMDRIGLTGTYANWNITQIGDVGLTGPVGNTGPQGAIGTTGPQGVAGVTGPTGIQGVQGPIGNTGIQGVQGPIGVTGPTGIQGAQGIQGISGVKGTTGATGVTGSVGVTGPSGAQGPTGLLGDTLAHDVTLVAGGVFYSRATYPRMEITKDYISGFLSAGVKRFWIDASSGQAKAGGVILDENGLYISPATDANYTEHAISWGSYIQIIGHSVQTMNKLELTVDTSAIPPEAVIELNAIDTVAGEIPIIRLSAYGSVEGLLEVVGGAGAHVNIGPELKLTGIPISRNADNDTLQIAGGTDVDHGGNLQVYGRDHSTRPGYAILRFGGYDAIGLFRFEHSNTDGTNTVMAAMDYRANFSLGNPAFPTTGNGTINLNNAVAPSSLTDSFVMYARDIVAGNSAAHFRTEAGNIVKLYTQAFIAAPAATVAGCQAAINSIRTLLINSGQMAAS